MTRAIAVTRRVPQIRHAVAGVGGTARATQSGGIHNIKLPNTQIGVVVPASC